VAKKARDAEFVFFVTEGRQLTLFSKLSLC